MVKCTINGHAIEVKEGTTIIQAYKILEQDIAHYCWHPALSIAGVCRLCMVEIQGMPKLQIACNTVVTEGMVVNNNSDKVKDAVRWGMDFHLINHPLDCPICDQAGECGLQEQYMKYGQYVPEMAERKVKKHKVVDLGPRVVLDSERCILCSRCVRFTDEVTKTYELGIFNRGDRSEIGTFENKPLNNNYSLNTVDICPVGALTSKDFRFRQRVWYLREADSVCTGCSTGCNIKVYYNKQGVFRVKPIHNDNVNGYWMCDEGRDVYKFVNRENRLLKAVKKIADQSIEMQPGAAVKELGVFLADKIKAQPDSVSVVLTGQMTNEEYAAFFKLTTNWGVKQVYHWLNNPTKVNDFDGLLLRGDRNPNTKGLLQSAKNAGVTLQPLADLKTAVQGGKTKTVIIVGPEIRGFYPDYEVVVKEILAAENIIWLASGAQPALGAHKGSSWQIPLKTFIEKSGTFVNHAGVEQKIEIGVTLVSEALTLTEAATLLTGQNLDANARPQQVSGIVRNLYVAERGEM